MSLEESDAIALRDISGGSDGSGAGSESGYDDSAPGVHAPTTDALAGLGGSSDDDAGIPIIPVRAKPKKSWVRELVEGFASMLHLGSFVVGIIAFVAILVQSLQYPTKSVCTTSCAEELTPPLANVGLPLLFILCLVVILPITILTMCSPGDWMDDPTTSKILAAVVFVLMLMAVVLLLAPLGRRGYVLPLTSSYLYQFDVTRVSGGTVRVTVNEYWSGNSLPETPGLPTVSMYAFEVSGVDAFPHNLASTAKSLVPVSLDGLFAYDDIPHSTEVGGLEAGKTYMFVLQPAKEGKYGTVVPGRGWTSASGPLEWYLDNTDSALPGLHSFDNAFVSTRAFTVCAWDGAGCTNL